VKVLIRYELVLTTESEKVQLRRSPEATPDVSGYRVPCEESEVALFQAFYPNSEVSMTVESVAEDFAQRGNGITTKCHGTRISTKDIPVSDRILARAERAFGNKITRRWVSDGFGLITWVPVFVPKKSVAESKSLRMERELPHSDSQWDIRRLPLRRKMSLVSISVSSAKVSIKPTLKNTVHEGKRGKLAILISKIPCRGRYI